MAGSHHHHLLLMSSFLVLILLSISYRVAAVPPPPCRFIRTGCPKYDVIKVEKDYEIRRYNSPLWMSTSPVQDTSLVQASNNAFMQLFGYIQGKNANNQHMQMTAPVITQVTPPDNNHGGPSTFVTSFYVPMNNPPSAEGLRVQKWGPTYAAVRQFGGFVQDSNHANEAEALRTSLKGSAWLDVITKSHPQRDYIVAQYNAPFEQVNRVNEIWMLFKM